MSRLNWLANNPQSSARVHLLGTGIQAYSTELAFFYMGSGEWTQVSRLLGSTLPPEFSQVCCHTSMRSWGWSLELQLIGIHLPKSMPRQAFGLRWGKVNHIVFSSHHLGLSISFPLCLCYVWLWSLVKASFSPAPWTLLTVRALSELFPLLYVEWKSWWDEQFLWGCQSCNFNIWQLWCIP